MHLQTADSLSLAPTQNVLHSMQVTADSDYVAELGDPGADGRLTADELAGDPEGAALVAALQQQIAEKLGVDASTVVINGLGVGDSSGRRRLADGAGAQVPGWAFCTTLSSCTVEMGA